MRKVSITIITCWFVDGGHRVPCQALLWPRMCRRVLDADEDAGADGLGRRSSPDRAGLETEWVVVILGLYKACFYIIPLYETPQSCQKSAEKY